MHLRAPSAHVLGAPRALPVTHRATCGAAHRATCGATHGRAAALRPGLASPSRRACEGVRP
jgi:hypothetical protein